MEMEVTQLCNEYSVTNRTLYLEDLEFIAQAGYKSILCSRPDEEDPGQIDFADIDKAARALGMECRQIEVFGHKGVTGENLQAFVDAWEELPRPIFGYCRSGNRAATLYKLSSNMR